MTTPTAIMAAGALVTLGLLIGGYFAAPGPYSFHAVPNATAGARINAITGEIRYCVLDPEQRGAGSLFRCQ